METTDTPIVPLLGALLVAEGLITQEQINATLLLQKQDYPDNRLGEILVRCGYISRKELDRVVSQQSEMRENLVSRMDAYVVQKADLSALVLSRSPAHALCRLLSSCQVAATVAPQPPDADHTPPYDLVLISAEAADHLDERLSAATTVGLLPVGADHEALTPAATALVRSYVDQARRYAALAKSIEQQRHSEFELQTVSTLFRTVTKAPNVQDALLKLMTVVRDLIAIEAGTLFQLDPSDNRLVFEVVIGPFQNELSQRRLSLDRGIAGWVARHGESLLIPDVSQDPRFEATFDRQTGFQTRSMLCVPLVAFGQVRGVIQLINKIDDSFTERDLSLLRITAAVGGMLLLFNSLAAGSSPSWLGDLF